MPEACRQSRRPCAAAGMLDAFQPHGSQQALAFSWLGLRPLHPCHAQDDTNNSTCTDPSLKPCRGWKGHKPVRSASNLRRAEDCDSGMSLSEGLAEPKMVLIGCHADDERQRCVREDLSQGTRQSLGRCRRVSSITHKPMCMGRVACF